MWEWITRAWNGMKEAASTVWGGITYIAEKTGITWLGNQILSGLEAVGNFIVDHLGTIVLLSTTAAVILLSIGIPPLLVGEAAAGEVLIGLITSNICRAGLAAAGAALLSAPAWIVRIVMECRGARERDGEAARFAEERREGDEARAENVQARREHERLEQERVARVAEVTELRRQQALAEQAREAAAQEQARMLQEIGADRARADAPALDLPAPPQAVQPQPTSPVPVEPVRVNPAAPIINALGVFAEQRHPIERPEAANPVFPDAAVANQERDPLLNRNQGAPPEEEVLIEDADEDNEQGLRFVRP